MIELLKQALILSGWGMGMTFLAIGALVIGMYLITTLIRDKTDTTEDNTAEFPFDSPVADGQRDPESVSIKNTEITANTDDQYRALAASVAVAITLSRESKVKLEEAQLITIPSAWNYYIRGRHLSQRSRYEQRKTRQQRTS